MNQTSINALQSIQEEMAVITKKEMGPRGFAKTGEVIEDLQKDIYLISKAIGDLCYLLQIEFPPHKI